MRAWGYVAGLLLGGALSWACGDEVQGDDDCAVGSVDCACTAGGGCDLDYTCIDGFCRNLNDISDGADDGVDDGADDGEGTGGGDNTAPTTGSTMSTSSADSGGETNDPDDSGDGLILDVGPTGKCVRNGCSQIDLLFAIDGTGSMVEEVAALSANQAFTEIVMALADVNCGGIDYRIGLTNDNDIGFLGSGANGNPWFDSQEMTEAEISAAFNSATANLGAGATPIGCEHVLASATDLLDGDATGFLRPDALLVVVLITDVDDHGYYDQVGFGGLCDGFLCTQTPAVVSEMYDTLVGLKGGEPEALATIVVAGDPGIQAGANTCGQPATCCGVGLGECAGAHHAPRLYEFADLQAGPNGVALNICDGAAQIPDAIEAALNGDIDLACQTFEPEG